MLTSPISITTTMKEIKVRAKNVYGNEYIYPACDTSKMFCDIAGTKILTLHILNIIAKNGYTITEIL